MNAVEAGLPVPQNVLAEYGVTENQTGKMRFMPEKLDADYMKAVESGDVEKQQRMVDEAAKMAGYGSPKVYHGTPAKSLDVFDVKKQGSHRKDKTDTGFFFTSREDLAKIYTKGTGSIISARLSLKNPYRVSVPEGYTWGVSNTPSKQSQVFYDFNNKEIQKAAKDGGHDGIIVEGSDTLYIVFSPSQIKSADPITRDNSGKVIPLSKRFDVGSRDIRYMPEAYRGTHTAPTSESAPAHDLTGNGVYPADVYTRPDWYEQDAGLEEMKKIKRLKGNPNASITIYRAVPVEVAEEARKTGSPSKYVFRAGDWVTTSKQYAKDHGDSALQGKYRIFSKSVKAKDIYTDGNSIFEWGYNPATEGKAKKSKTKGNSSAIANASKLK
jgi:hypothetical protein